MDKRIFMFLGGVILIGGLVFLLRYLLERPPDCAVLSFSVSPQTIIMQSGDSIQFDDQTPNAKEWLWDFGDGEISDRQSGKHFYINPGHWFGKLTVNGVCVDTFSVLVQSFVLDTDRVKVAITGPDKPIHARQRVQFKGTATGATQWWWKFGESGTIDSKEQDPYYTFQTPGEYTINLKTDVSDKPGELTVKVLPRVLPKTGGAPPIKLPSKDEIRARLQVIADNGSYTKDDLAWIHQYFMNGIATRASCNLPVKIDRIEALFQLFAVNSNSYDILSVSNTVDSKYHLISSLTVQAKER